MSILQSFAGAMLAFSVAACGYGMPQFITPKFDPHVFVPPDPTQFARRESAVTAVTSADLVDGSGNCAGAPPAALAEGATALLPRGIALQMTECEVVRIAGPPVDVQIGANPRGDRTVSMTYPAADRPIYQFTAGRLTSVERGAEPPPEPAKKKPAPKRQNNRQT